MTEGTTDNPEHELERFRRAIMPDTFSKRAYAGRLSQTETVTIITSDGTPYETEVIIPISWLSISKILDLISERIKR